jgi:pilus assembly protein Flp/PilA
VSAIRIILRMLGADERGATAIEYGLIVGLIAVASIGGMQQLGGGVGGKWGNLASTMNTYMP